MDLSKKQEVFKEVVAANLKRISNGINNKSFEYSILDKHKLEDLSEDEVRKTAIVFFIKNLYTEFNEYLQTHI